MQKARCMPFSGTAGHILVAAMGALSVVLCVVRYWWLHRHGKDTRPLRVYAYDMSKIVVSQSAAWVVNLIVTDRIYYSLEDDTTVEGIGLYAGVFFMDIVIGVPLGLWMGKWFNEVCDAYWRRYLLGTEHVPVALTTNSLTLSATFAEIEDDVFEAIAAFEDCEGSLKCEVTPNGELPPFARIAEQNRMYGKYARHHCGNECDVFVDSYGPELESSWWWSQCTTWSIVVAISRVLSGLLLLGSLSLSTKAVNPLMWVASAVTDLKISCAAKQWWIAGFFRIAIDVGQYLVIDAVNKLRAKSAHIQLE